MITIANSHFHVQCNFISKVQGLNCKQKLVMYTGTVLDFKTGLFMFGGFLIWMNHP